MASDSWVLPEPNQADWVKIEGHTQGSAVAQAVAFVEGAEGDSTEGDALASAVALVGGVEGASTQGGASASSLASVQGEEGTGTEGSAQASSGASVEGNKGGITQGAVAAQSVTAVVAGGLATPIYVFANRGREATADDTLNGGNPTEYSHTATHDGSDLLLTTAKT